MVLKNWYDVIDLDFPELPEEIPGYFGNRDLEARRKRLDELSRLEELKEREYQKFLQQPEQSSEQTEPPAMNTFRWIHYIYGAYELAKYLLN